MDWNQIEVKWYAMARRVRADLPPAKHVAPQPAYARSTVVGKSMPIPSDAMNTASEHRDAMPTK